MKTLLVVLTILTACATKQGPTGGAGAPSAPCTTTAVPGGVTISCPDGTHQTVYNGADVTGMTPVKVCPNVDTVYPTSFAEYLFCLNNQLYGVYWTGSQAFWSLIPPGVYNSTSPQGCQFTVLPNCQVN